MNPRETKSFQCIKKSISEFAGAMFRLLPKPLFRDLHEKLHQAFGKLDWQVDICLFVFRFAALLFFSDLVKQHFAFRGEGISVYLFSDLPKSASFVILGFGEKVLHELFFPQGGGDSLLREDAAGDF